MRISRLGIAAILAVALALLSAAPGRAEDHYPSRLVKIVVPAAAGSTTDTLARLLADQLSRKWGQSVIVENISGAAMNLGAERVAHAEPDGYTLLVAPPSPLALNQMLFKDITYDPTQFTPITLVAKIANVLSVRNDFPAKTVQDLIAYAKANPGKLTFASQGVGSTAHLSASQLELLAGIKMVHVPYRGAMPALNDVMAGHVDMFFDTLATSVPLFRAGKIKILAVAGPERAAAIPDVPTIAESGLPGFRSITWFGLVAPPKTPADLVAHINRDAVEILKSKDVMAKLEKLSLEPGATSPADTAKFFAAETQLWGKVIKETGLKPQ